jgi:hypothetical protein
VLVVGSVGGADAWAPPTSIPSEVRPGWLQAGSGGQLVVHVGKEIHYDGARDEETVIRITGMGPATGVAAEQK